MKDMKKIIYIIALLCIAACNGTTPDTPTPGPDPGPGPSPEPPVEETLTEKISGEWHCVASDIDADIYLSLLSETNTFELYQKIGEGAYRLYNGTWSLDEEAAMLTGKYNDGTPWGSGYSLVLSEDKNSMTLTPSEGSEQVYRRESIPANVKDGCVVVVKSGTDDSTPVL